MTRRLGWIYVLLSIVIAVLSKEVKSVLNPIFNDFRLLELDIKALFAASKIECVAICVQTSGCMAIQFNTNTMECRCFDRKFISMDNATYGTQNGFLYYDITTLIPWVDVGPFYLYVTPGSYHCSEGPVSLTHDIASSDAPCVQIWNNALDDASLTYSLPILCQKRLQ